jgi:hypothetical protein
MQTRKIPKVATKPRGQPLRPQSHDFETSTFSKVDFQLLGKIHVSVCFREFPFPALHISHVVVTCDMLHGPFEY